MTKTRRKNILSQYLQVLSSSIQDRVELENQTSSRDMYKINLIFHAIQQLVQNFLKNMLKLIKSMLFYRYGIQQVRKDLEHLTRHFIIILQVLLLSLIFPAEIPLIIQADGSHNYDKISQKMQYYHFLLRFYFFQEINVILKVSKFQSNKLFNSLKNREWDISKQVLLQE